MAALNGIISIISISVGLFILLIWFLWKRHQRKKLIKFYEQKAQEAMMMNGQAGNPTSMNIIPFLGPGEMRPGWDYNANAQGGGVAAGGQGQGYVYPPTNGAAPPTMPVPGGSSQPPTMHQPGSTNADTTVTPYTLTQPQNAIAGPSKYTLGSGADPFSTPHHSSPSLPLPHEPSPPSVTGAIAGPSNSRSSQETIIPSSHTALPPLNVTKNEKSQPSQQTSSSSSTAQNRNQNQQNPNTSLVDQSNSNLNRNPSNATAYTDYTRYSSPPPSFKSLPSPIGPDDPRAGGSSFGIIGGMSPPTCAPVLPPGLELELEGESGLEVDGSAGESMGGVENRKDLKGKGTIRGHGGPGGDSDGHRIPPSISRREDEDEEIMEVPRTRR